MASEAFYSTAAQVIPTLLIAFSIETNTMVRRMAERSERLRTEPLGWRHGVTETEDIRRERIRTRARGIRWIKALLWLVLASVTVAELAAILCLESGPPPSLAATIDGLLFATIVTTTAAVMGFPLLLIGVSDEEPWNKYRQPGQTR